MPGPQNKKNSNFEVKMAPRNAVYEIQITQNNGLLSFVFADDARRQFEFPAAQYYMFSKQSVKNKQKFSFFISKAKQLWMILQIQTQSEKKWLKEVPNRKKKCVLYVKISN